MSYHYAAPLRDMRFVIERVLQAPAAWARCPAWADLDADTASAVLEEAAQLGRGLGHQEMATQNALRYAQERLQMKQPIAHHPAMRHTLLRLQVLTETQRVIAYRAARKVSRSWCATTQRLGGSSDTGPLAPLPGRS